MSKPHTQFEPLTIQRLKNLKEKSFDYNLEFQRSSVWRPRQKKRLIESLLNGYTIGSFVFRPRRNNKYEVLDGQQRLKTIYSFLRDGFKTAKDSTVHPNITYSELLHKDPDAYANFNAAQLFAINITGGEEQDIAEIFTRLQEGTPLNVAEKLNAYTLGGLMRREIIKLSRHRLFKNIGIDGNRFKHREICAAIVSLEIKTDFDKKIFPNLRFGEYAALYKDFKDELPSKLIPNIRTNLQFIHRSLSNKGRLFLTDKSDLLQIYLLVSYLFKENYVVSPDVFGKFIMSFITDLGREKKSNFIRQYETLKKAGQTQKNIEKRFILMYKVLFQKFHLKRKDENRLFTVKQKRAIYIDAAGICSECNKKVNIKDAAYHHRIRYAYAGETDVKNGLLMHKWCHIRHHKKHGFK